MNLRTLSLYVGGFLGPFGTLVILPMFPELRESFDASSQAVGWGFTAYLFPFSLLLLVSGTLGERWGRRKTIQRTYLAYAVASVLCAIAPNLGLFIVGRALQGVANAFISPLLIAGLAEMVPEERFGRSLGFYSSFQALGSGLAPLLGGLAADTDWRLAFWGTAAVSLVLAAAPPVGEAQQTERPSMRPLLTRRMLLLGAGAFIGAAGPLGISVLVGVATRDELGLSGFRAGLVLFSSAAAAMVLGPVWGRAADRFGLWRVGLVGVLALTVSSMCLALVGTPVPLAVVSAVVGGLSALVVVVLQGIGATLIPDNRGGALSFLLSFRFLGHAVGPIIWIPVFEVSPTAAFVGAGALGFIMLAAFVGAAPTRTSAAG